MAARSYRQAATPTSFGVVVASWGRPVLRQHLRLSDALVPLVSLSGVTRTLAAMGEKGPAVRAALAAELGLGDTRASWHSERDGGAIFAGWMAMTCPTLAKMGDDLILLTQSGIDEVRIAGAGGSSTMPQKHNPVGPSVLVANARQLVVLAGVVQGAGVHRQNRDGGYGLPNG